MLLALNLVPSTPDSSFAEASEADGAALITLLSWRSRSARRRLRAAISERWVAETFLRGAISRRSYLRAIREISSFRADATLAIESEVK